MALIYFRFNRYEAEMGAIVRVENFVADFRQWINNRYGNKPTPEDILGCIYAVLHAPGVSAAICRVFAP